MKPLSKLLHSGEGVLADLAARSEQQVRLDTLLDGFLDQPFRSHIKVACLREGTLVLCADSPAWGHRIRYLSPGIVDYFRDQGLPEVRSVSITVRAADTHAPAASAPAAPTPIPESAAAALEDAARSVGEGRLARRLERLARRARRRE